MGVYEDYLIENGISSKPVLGGTNNPRDYAGEPVITSSGLANQVSALEGQRAWDALGLDPSAYSANATAAKKGLGLSAADVQAQLMSRNEFDYESASNYAYAQQLYDSTQSFRAQVEQMKEAGLNPALMYGGSASSTGGADFDSGTASTSGNSGTAQQANSALNSTKASAALGAFSQLAQIPAIIQGIAATREDIRGKELDNEGKEIENDIKRETKDDAIAGTNAENQSKVTAAAAALVDLEVKKETKDDAIQQVRNKTIEQYADIRAKNTQSDKTEIETRIARITEKMATIDAAYQEKIKQLEIQATSARIYLARSQAHLNYKNASKVKYEIELLEQQAITAAEQAGLFRAQAETEGSNKELVDKKVQYADQEAFLDYFRADCQWISTCTQVSDSKLWIKSDRAAYDVVYNGIDHGLEALKFRYGDSGFYPSASGDRHYQMVTPETSQRMLNFSSWGEIHGYRDAWNSTPNHKR